MGVDFMQRSVAESFIFGQPWPEKILTSGDKADADQVVRFAGEDQADAVPEEHEVVDGVGYFEHFDFAAPLSGSPVLIEFGDIEFKAVFESVHQFDGTLFQ